MEAVLDELALADLEVDSGIGGTIEKACEVGPAWYRPFLTQLALQPNVAAAIRASGKGRSTVYRHREGDPLLRAAWDEVLELALDDLEGDIWQRAGKSDTLGIFILKNRRRTIYGDTATVNHRHSGTVDVQLLPAPQLHDVIALLQEAGALQLPPGDIIEGEIIEE